MEDGRGEQAGLVKAECLTLDEAGEALYFLDGKNGRNYLRRVSLRDQEVTTVFEGPASMGRRRISGLSCHDGLLLAVCEPPFIVCNPSSALFKALAPGAKPSYETILKVMRGLGITPLVRTAPSRSPAPAPKVRS